MSEQQRRGVKERLEHRGGPGQGTMYLDIQLDGGASSSYGGWKSRVLTEGWGIVGSQLNPFWLVPENAPYNIIVSQQFDSKEMIVSLAQNVYICLFHSFIHFILPLTRNTTTVYRNALKIIYNIPSKLFTRLNVVKARKPIQKQGGL